MSVMYRFNEIGFRSRIEPTDDGCWIWHGAKNKAGFGTFSYGCTSRPAHRLAWVYFKNELIPEKVCVRQSCGNKLCVNPDHLYLGKAKDVKKQPYQKKGIEKKLSQNQINKIFEVLREAQRKIKAEEFGVSETTLWKVKNGLY